MYRCIEPCVASDDLADKPERELQIETKQPAIQNSEKISESYYQENRNVGHNPAAIDRRNLFQQTNGKTQISSFENKFLRAEVAECSGTRQPSQLRQSPAFHALGIRFDFMLQMLLVEFWDHVFEVLLLRVHWATIRLSWIDVARTRRHLTQI